MSRVFSLLTHDYVFLKGTQFFFHQAFLVSLPPVQSTAIFKLNYKRPQKEGGEKPEK